MLLSLVDFFFYLSNCECANVYNTHVRLWAQIIFYEIPLPLNNKTKLSVRSFYSPSPQDPRTKYDR